MNEILIAILLPIILTGIAYGIAEFFMKLFDIQHPKNSFLVYFLVFLVAFSFIPLTYSALSEPSINNSNKADLIQQENGENKTFPNISDSSISSKITPIHNSNTKENKTNQIPSRFILEISWYDFIINETNPIGNENVDQKELSKKTEEKAKTPLFASIQNNINKIPPILLFLSTLTIVASAFVIYHLFIGKKHYLKKINAYQINNTRFANIVQNISREINIKNPKIFMYNGTPNAFVLGYPGILVVSNSLLTVLSEQELKTTIRHELTHLKHHDVLLKAFIQATRIICIFNPFVHIVARKIFNKRELLADSSYNINQGDKVSFMEALIKIAEYTQSATRLKNKQTPAISVSLLELSSYHPTMTDRFISLFKQWKKKTILTMIVSSIILLSTTSAVFLTHSYIATPKNKIDMETQSEEIVDVEKQYLVEDVTYTTFYQNDEKYHGKMIHKTLYNVISLPTFSNSSNIKEIINYILLRYYQSQQSATAF